MQIKLLPEVFSVCQLPDGEMPDTKMPFCFFAKTDEETSLVCPTAHCPETAVKRRDGWLALKILGPLDFSLIGVLSGIAGALAESGVPIFAVSTYDTDYILFERAYKEKALSSLRAAGYQLNA